MIRSTASITHVTDNACRFRSLFLLSLASLGAGYSTYKFQQAARERIDRQQRLSQGKDGKEGGFEVKAERSGGGV